MKNKEYQLIDLHSHTIYSDGSYTLKEILTEAEESNIKTLSITDHDSVKAYFELDKIRVTDYYSGKIITGGEFNCTFNNVRIELLGYNFDKNNVNKWLSEYYSEKNVTKYRLQELNELIELCQKNNIILSTEIKYNSKEIMPIDAIYYEIRKNANNKKLFEESVWNSRTLFYRECTTNENFILYNNNISNIPLAKEISDLIRENGGKVFLAHPFVYSLNNYIEFLDEIRTSNVIDGLECYHSNFNEKQIDILINYCLKNNLYISGGSDCHGTKYPEIKLGTGYNNSILVDKKYISKWLKI